MGGSRVSSLGGSCASVSAHVTVTSQADALSHMGSVPTPQEGPPLSLDPSSHRALGLQTPGPTTPGVGS